jgi:seryl-tRNA synthetase
MLVSPRTVVDVDWEVRDLLKTASRQAASYLAQAKATEALLEARKFDAFNRMSAFVVHDLKNLIAQLSLMLKNADRHRDNPAFQADMLATVEHVVDRMNALMLQLPGIPYEGAPVGPDESFNAVVRTEGTPPRFDFGPLDHVALIEKNDWADLSRVTQVSGSRTYCLKGALALLEAKLMAWALEKISAANFTPITVPAIAREQAFLNQGQFPGHREETYELPNDDLWLGGRPKWS